MKPPTRLPAQGLSRLLLSSTTPLSRRSAALAAPAGIRGAAAAAAAAATTAAIHTSSPDPAEVSPFHATGPPPEPPQPAAEHPYAKIERRRKQAELLRSAREIRDAEGKGKGKTPLRKRFWQDVTVKEVQGSQSFPSCPPFPSRQRARCWAKRARLASPRTSPRAAAAGGLPRNPKLTASSPCCI